MRKLVAIATAVLCGACVPADQPDSFRTVEAIEVPLSSSADHDELVAILRRHAAGDAGMHVDEKSREFREVEAQTVAAPKDRGTIFVGVWRGANDDSPEAEVEDIGHPQRAWLTFARGEFPERSSAFRRGVVREVMNRWPNSKVLPILPEGNIPLPPDMTLTSEGYKVDPTAAKRYDLDPASPFVAHGSGS